MAFTYTTDKKSALTELKAETLRDWALAIPTSKLTDIVTGLPAVKGGFRPGKDAPIRLLAYFGRMNRWVDDDWLLLGRIWTLWTHGHPQIEQALGITTSEELDFLAQEMTEDHDSRHTAILKLVVSSVDSTLTQETVQVWYDMGPFPPDSEVSMAITMARTAADTAVPTRLVDLEQRTGRLHEGLDQLSADLKGVVAQLRSMGKFPGMVTTLDSTVRTGQETMKHVAGRLSELEQLVGRLGKNVDAQDQSMRKTRGDLANVQPQLDSVASAVLKSSALVDALGLDRSELTCLFNTLAAELQRLQEDVNRLGLAEAAPSGHQQFIAPEPATRRAERPQPLVYDISAGDPTKLNGVKPAAAQLASNLNRLGIKLPQAQSLALDVLAALATGQLVTFSGSLAEVVAEGCALSLAGANAKLMRIPVGLLDGEAFDNHLESWLSSGDSTPVGIVICGANCSALEVYGTSLKRLVIDRIMQTTNRGRQLFLFAVVTDGPAGIPYGRELLEMGPLLDTDALGWLDSPARPVVPGTLGPEDWSNSDGDMRFDWEETWVPDWFTLGAGPLWRRAVTRAALFRATVTSGASGSQLLPPDLAFGWILPIGLQIWPDEIHELVENVTMDSRGRTLLLLNGVDVERQ